MTLFFVECRFSPYILLTTVKIGLITDFGLELLLITDFGGTPLRPSFLWRSKESYNELITRISVGGNKDIDALRGNFFAVQIKVIKKL